MKISVTQADIETGDRHSSCLCPIALAGARAFGQRVSVGAREMGTHDSLEFRGDLPREAREFIHDFDSGRPVEPFEFEVFNSREEE